MTTQHFLVPMDFSAHADHALDYAIALAEKLQARLTLLHVIQQMHMGVGDVAAALPYAQEKIANRKKRAEEDKSRAARKRPALRPV